MTDTPASRSPLPGPALPGSSLRGVPLPGTGRAAVAVPAPGPGPQRWVGAPSAALDHDGTLAVAYRTRVAGEDIAPEPRELRTELVDA